MKQLLSSSLDKEKQSSAIPLCINCKKNEVYSWRNLYCEDCMVKLRREIEASLEKAAPVSENEEATPKSKKRKLKKGDSQLSF